MITIRPSALTRNVDTTQKTAEVSGESNDDARSGVPAAGRNAEAWNLRLRRRRKWIHAHQTDQKTGSASQDEVEQQQSLQFVSRELPLPCRDAGGERR